jgi:hypothetical protein
VPRRRIQPRPAVEVETVSLRLPAHLVRAVDQYAKFLGGSTDRTYIVTQAIELALASDAEFQKTQNGGDEPSSRSSVRGSL